MTTWNRYSILGVVLVTMAATATEKSPIEWEIVSEPLPIKSSMYGIYHTTYKFQSNLPFIMPNPLSITAETSTDEFSVIDNCSNTRLRPGESCNVTLTLNPEHRGLKTAGLNIDFSGFEIPALPRLRTLAWTNWVGAIGADYSPNHYPSDITLNNHDVFYVGMNTAKQPITNVYMELAQLQAAGFNTVRSYQTVEYSWIDIINQAQTLNMNVVYEAVIPQNGTPDKINDAVEVLTNVIKAVGVTTFQDTVSLVFAGRENYSDTDINYLITAVKAIQAALTANNLSTPVSSALVAGDLIDPTNPTDIQNLVNSYSPHAPLAFDPYPFQFGVPIAKAVSSRIPPQEMNSIAWDYQQVMKQSFYTSNPRPILMAETGWATQGTNDQYFCFDNPTNPCKPGVTNAAVYLKALYAYVRDTSNNSGALVFEAYDEPAKDSDDPNDAENFYGVFDTNCNLKNNNLNLLPNTAYDPASNYGCQGFVQGALFAVVGGSVTNQPPFTVQITQTNPQTNQSASMTVNVPTQDRTDTNIYPWPNFLVYNNATIKLTGTSGTVCTGAATVSGNPPTLTLPDKLNCTGPYPVGCFGTNCFLSEFF